MPEQAHNATVLVTLEAETCFKCGIAFGISAYYRRRLLNEKRGESFYCPAGHEQRYIGKSEADKLRDQLAQKDREITWARERAEAARAAADSASRRASAFKGQVTRVRKRVRNGVCPCCNRSFSALARHMETKHPDYAGQDIG